MASQLPLDLGHTHTITLTAEQVTTLRRRGTVTDEISSSVGHTHTSKDHLRLTP